GSAVAMKQVPELALAFVILEDARFCPQPVAARGAALTAMAGHRPDAAATCGREQANQRAPREPPRWIVGGCRASAAVVVEDEPGIPSLLESGPPLESSPAVQSGLGPGVRVLGLGLELTLCIA